MVEGGGSLAGGPDNRNLQIWEQIRSKCIFPLRAGDNSQEDKADHDLELDFSLYKVEGREFEPLRAHHIFSLGFFYHSVSSRAAAHSPTFLSRRISSALSLVLSTAMVSSMSFACF